MGQVGSEQDVTAELFGIAGNVQETSQGLK